MLIAFRMQIWAAISEKVFDSPIFYEFFQTLVKKRKFDSLIEEYLKPEIVGKVIDFGCGNGKHSLLFSNASYLGIDPLEQCIKVANKRYRKDPNIIFSIGNELSLRRIESDSVDLLFGIGVLHHMQESEIEVLISECKRIIRLGGRIQFFEPYFGEGQSRIKRFIMKLDRGQQIRTINTYLSFFDTQVFRIECTSFPNHLKIPYDLTRIMGVKINP